MDETPFDPSDGNRSPTADSRVEQWQENIHPSLIPEETSSVARLYTASSGLWCILLRALSTQDAVADSSIKKLESAYSYYVLWADGYGIRSGKFEQEIHKSQRAGDQSIRLLQSICKTLSQRLASIVNIGGNVTDVAPISAKVSLAAERLTVLVQGDYDSDDSSDDEDGFTELPLDSDSLEKVVDDLRMDTQCLMELGDRFEDQVKNPIISEATGDPETYEPWTPSVHFKERVLHSYPTCEPNLAERLGEAVWLRLSRLKNPKPQYMSFEADHDGDVEASDEAPQASSNSPTDVRKPTPSVMMSLFQDSALGTSIPATLTTDGARGTAGAERDKPSIFMLPELARKGEPFPCRACGKKVQVTSGEQWGEHLLSDIEPYVCPESCCLAPLFATIREWEHHIARMHPSTTIWEEFRCRICGQETSANRSAKVHLLEHMEDLAIKGFPYGDLEKSADTESIHTINYCEIPFQRSPSMAKPSTQNYKGSPNDIEFLPDRIIDDISFFRTYSKEEDTAPQQGSTNRRKLKGMCARCKRRRMRCDKKRPSCTQCVTADIECPGYPSRSKSPFGFSSDLKQPRHGNESLDSHLSPASKSPKITSPQVNMPEQKEYKSPKERSEQPSQPKSPGPDSPSMEDFMSKARKILDAVDGPDLAAKYGGKYESHGESIVTDPCAYIAYDIEESRSLPVASEMPVPCLSQAPLPSDKNDEPVIKSADASSHAVAGQSPQAKDERSLNPNTDNLPSSGFNHGPSLYGGVSSSLGSFTMSLGTDSDHSFYSETFPPLAADTPMPPLSKMPPPSRTNVEILGISEEALKRGRNTLAARKLRERRARHTQGMMERIEKLEKDQEHWRATTTSKTHQGQEE
ncbi:Aspercryptin biosynthesis cluster-specific transcription regulator atnN [Apiospora arundinis]